MISVFTPTHNARWLEETYDSLSAQTFTDWEWIIVPNGGLLPNDLPTRIQEDSRIRIIATELIGVGALKRFACNQCKGDMFVELDHDDRLTPDALSRLYEASVKTPDGFYYSDFVNLYPDGRSHVYGSAFGWQSYQFSYDGEDLTAMRAFPASARSLCEIYFAPNHVRAWSRKAYTLTGGHDAALSVGDDHDLVCRTYLTGVPFVHIPTVLYIYRDYLDSTCNRDNKNVQIQQKENQNRYIHSLIYEECRRRNLRMVDIGPAQAARHGFESFPLVVPGKPFQPLSESYFKPDTVGCFWASDVLQRIAPQQFVQFINTVYDKLGHGGWLLTQTPSTDDGEGNAGRGAFQDLTHVSYWNQNSFFYITHRDYSRYFGEKYRSRFQSVRAYTAYPSPWHKSNYIPYVYADLYALKGQHAAGLSTI